MLQNYFFLNRLVIEAKDLISDAKILDIFSQEKSKLVLFLLKDNIEFFLEFCVVPGSSYFSIKKKYSRAKKNTINFFKSSIGDKIESVLIADDDRIIKLNCEHSEFYFAIRGKFTNVFHFKNDQVAEAFKMIDHEILIKTKDEFEEKNFISHYNKPDLNPDFTEDYPGKIRKKYPFIGNELIKEVNARASDPASYPEILKKVLSDIEKGKPTVFIDENSGEVNLGFETFKCFPLTRIEIFKDIFDAQNFFLSKEHFFSSKQVKIKLIRKHLEKELTRLSNKINNLESVIEKSSKKEEYSKKGKLLLANLGIIRPGMTSVTVDDIFSDGKKIEIKLNKKLSPQKNVDYYFNKSKSEKTGFAKSQELLRIAESDFQHIKQIETRLENSETIDELKLIMKELKIKEQVHSGRQNEKEDLKQKFKRYLIDGKYYVFIGKDSQNNDLLTTKFAKPNDFWFHARGVSGSHVVLRVENTKEAIPKSALKKAAAIAAFHSKAKNAGIVPVAYTYKKYVVKKKGDPAGTVRLLREDVLLVKPEIPGGCEFISSHDG